ncbi:MAG: hypothetical protein R2772_07945 [Chitinophagales bacterium]
MIKSNSKCKNSEYQFRVLPANSLSEVSEISASSLFSTPSFIKQSAQVSKHIQHQVVEVFQQKEKLALLYFQIMPFKGDELRSYIPEGEDCIINKSLEAIVDLALERVNWNLAVLGNVFLTGDKGQIFYKEVSAKEKWEILDQACKALSKSQKIDAFLISDLREEDLVNHDIMVNKSYRLFEVEPDLIFDIQESWKTFDDYLDSIVSKYRVRTKKVFSKSNSLLIKDLTAEEIKENTKLIFSLYKNVLSSASFKLAEISQNYFYDFKLAYPEKFKLRAYYHEGEMLGFISYFVDAKALNINLIGIDYKYNKEHCVYQRILYDCIEQGIQERISQIHFGRTASEIKTSVGAVPKKGFSLLKHNSRIPNIVIKPLTTYLKPEPFEVRKPFRVEQAS